MAKIYDALPRDDLSLDAVGGDTGFLSSEDQLAAFRALAARRGENGLWTPDNVASFKALRPAAERNFAVPSRCNFLAAWGGRAPEHPVETWAKFGAVPMEGARRGAVSLCAAWGGRVPEHPVETLAKFGTARTEGAQTRIVRGATATNYIVRGTVATTVATTPRPRAGASVGQSRRRRGRELDRPGGSRGDAAAASWIVRGLVTVQAPRSTRST